ncbi:MAG: hypothetical protein QG604_761 [Candidatus Dependentiae bacterium]|nr:hypothetical protein [Candidatus Dependentiae bacterium]
MTTKLSLIVLCTLSISTPILYGADIAPVALEMDFVFSRPYYTTDKVQSAIAARVSKHHISPETAQKAIALDAKGNLLNTVSDYCSFEEFIRILTEKDPRHLFKKTSDKRGIIHNLYLPFSLKITPALIVPDADDFSQVILAPAEKEIEINIDLKPLITESFYASDEEIPEEPLPPVQRLKPVIDFIDKLCEHYHAKNAQYFSDLYDNRENRGSYQQVSARSHIIVELECLRRMLISKEFLHLIVTLDFKGQVTVHAIHEADTDCATRELACEEAAALFGLDAE